MLPRVKILFENGRLGGMSPNSDGTMGLAITATAVPGKFELAKAYVLRSTDDLSDLGITSSDTDANAFLYKTVKEFYAEGGDGLELWVMGFPPTVKQSDMVDKTKDYAKKLIQAAAGEIKCLAVAFQPATGYTPTIQNGLDSDLTAAMLNAQLLAEWAADTMYAPLFVILEAREFTGNAVDLPDLSTHQYNRVGVLLGDTVSGSKGAAIGLLAGRIAKNPVQRHIGRVKDGAANSVTAYIGSQSATLADVETIYNKGFISFRTFVGKSGYYFNDDNLATSATDDYRSIARRRTIDKAFRVAYDTMLNELNEEIPVTAEGKLVPALAKSWETAVETAIIGQMTAEGNLGVDTTDANDTGVTCSIDTNQNVVSGGKIEMILRVRPYGYAKYIDVKLGFQTTN